MLISIDSINRSRHCYKSYKNLMGAGLLRLFSILIAIPIVIPIVIKAQTVDAVALDEDFGFEIVEIIVTARKREENLQKTPIAISVFSGEGIEQRGITKLNDLSAFSPNMTFQNNPGFSGASNTASIYIRGVGQKDFLPTVEPGVGLYVDGVYIARSVGAVLDLMDIAQVEVLRGPQGTLFGRNTIGGAISITTQKPDDERRGKLEVAIGTDNAQTLKASVSLPLTNQLFSSFSMATISQDGYVSRLDGNDLGNDDTQTGRVSLLWSPEDALEVVFSAEYSKDREDGPPMSLLGINLGIPVAPGAIPMVTIHNTVANVAAGGPATPCATSGTPINLSVSDCYDLRYRLGRSKNAGTAQAQSDVDLYGASLNITRDFITRVLGDNLTFKSITSWRNLDSEFSRDADHSPHRVAHLDGILDQEQFSQEFQLLGSTEDARLNWILGLYYFEESGESISTLDFTVANFQSGGEFENKSKAVFTQATYKLTEQLSLTAGLRYTNEDKAFRPDQIIFQNYFAGSGDPLLDPPFLQAGQRILPMIEKEIEISETTPMVNLAYHWSEALMTYVSYSEGFKSGGFTQRVFPPQIPGVTVPAGTSDEALIPNFESEFVDVYELGGKYQGWDNRFRFNAAIFHTEYDDLQVQVFTGIAPVTKNAASAKVSGWELEMSLVPLEFWLLETSYGWLNPRYDKINTAETLIQAGNEFERVAKRTASFSISREFNTRYGSFIARADWVYRSKEYMDAFNLEIIAQDSYDLLNAGVFWEGPMERWNIMLNVKNITDEDYLITGVNADSLQIYEGVYSRGREWYLTARFNF